MHELSIAISMIDQITEESANRGGLDVEAVHLRLGVFSGVDKDALLFSWELACRRVVPGRSAAGDENHSSRHLLCRLPERPDSSFGLPTGHPWPAAELQGQKIVTSSEIEVASLEVAA